MSSTDMALAFAIAGGAVVAVGVGAVVAFLRDRFAHFAARSDEAARTRSELGDLIARGQVDASRATMLCEEILFAQRRDRAARLRMDEQMREAQRSRMRAARNRYRPRR